MRSPVAAKAVVAPAATKTTTPLVSYDFAGAWCMNREEVEQAERTKHERMLALIVLEEMEAATRPKLRVTLKNKVGLGEVWKVVGTPPELGRMNPDCGQVMKWSEGDVWTLDMPIRTGTHTFKVVLRNADGAHVWEEGEDRVVEVLHGTGPEQILEFNIEPKMPWHEQM